ncbi:MAG TPA: transcriptional regulator, partial [Phototrophicaceae bacterium]|jgi:predicted transcriptional regulator|nr:transcriptional regulator [Phototrophicaceae bacterium]
MLLPSEIESKSLIPAIRAILSKKLIQDYSLKEETVAKLLGITQAAVSNYIRGTRGDLSLVTRLENNFEVMKMIGDITKDLSMNKAYAPSTMTKFIQLCNYMRYTFIICDVHHSIESNIDKSICEQCEVILTGSRFS